MSSTLNYDASRNQMITVTVQLTSMSRRYYVFFLLTGFSAVWSGTGRRYVDLEEVRDATLSKRVS